MGAASRITLLARTDFDFSALPKNVGLAAFPLAQDVEISVALSLKE